MIEMELVGVRVELPANQPIVLLKEREGTRFLPIWIGAVEATAIAFAMQGVEPPRPLTHDLIIDLLESVGARIERVTVTDLREGTFYAQIHLSIDGRSLTVSSRPSDAIAIASRNPDTPLFATPDVLETAGIELDETDSDDELSSVDPEEEVRQFREFLDDITPEDFQG